jgi:hypothetical protein
MQFIFVFDLGVFWIGFTDPVKHDSVGVRILNTAASLTGREENVKLLFQKEDMYSFNSSHNWLEENNFTLPWYSIQR